MNLISFTVSQPRGESGDGGGSGGGVTLHTVKKMRGQPICYSLGPNIGNNATDEAKINAVIESFTGDAEAESFNRFTGGAVAESFFGDAAVESSNGYIVVETFTGDAKVESVTEDSEAETP
ncbi:hypothetical protein Bca101_018273 [Brassica carinata]